LDPSRVKQLIREALVSGTVSFSMHALRELAKDDLTTVDCTNILRGGVFEPGEMERGTWRYRVRTARMSAVVAFRSESHVVVVTAWREKP
jgi:hypothetical protein